LGNFYNAEGVYRLVRRTQLPFFILRFSFFIFHFNFCFLIGPCRIYRKQEFRVIDPTIFNGSRYLCISPSAFKIPSLVSFPKARGR